MCGDGGVLLVGSSCSGNTDGCPMLIHDTFPFLSYVIFPSLYFFPTFVTSNLFVARKPVNVVACPFVASYLVDFCPMCCGGDYRFCSFLMLFGILFIALHCHFCGRINQQCNLRQGKSKHICEKVK